MENILKNYESALLYYYANMYDQVRTIIFQELFLMSGFNLFIKLTYFLILNNNLIILN